MTIIENYSPIYPEWKFYSSLLTNKRGYNKLIRICFRNLEDENLAIIRNYNDKCEDFVDKIPNTYSRDNQEKEKNNRYIHKKNINTLFKKNKINYKKLNKNLRIITKKSTIPNFLRNFNKILSLKDIDRELSRKKNKLENLRNKLQLND